MILVASDFDETFYDKKIEHNIKLVEKLIEQGNLFAIITGRPLSSLKNEIEIPLPYSYAICSCGAIIYNQEDTILYRNDIPNDIAHKIEEELKKDKNLKSVFLSIEENAPYERISAVYAIYQDREKAEKKLKKIKQKYKEIDGYLGRTSLNIIHKNTSKKNALLVLQEILGLKKEEIITIGDGENDILMNEYFTSYAMESGHETLKQKSTYIVKDFEEAINKIIKKENI